MGAIAKTCIACNVRIYIYLDVGKLSVKLLMMNVWRKVYYLTLDLIINLPTSDTKMRKSAKNKYCGIDLIFIWY